MASYRKWVRDEEGNRRRVGPSDPRPAISWIVSLLAGRHPTTGKKKLVSETFATKGEAERWARKQESLKDDGISPATTRKTLAQYVAEWLPIHAAQVRDTTSYNIGRTLRKWVIEHEHRGPLIGSKQLRKLTAQDFDRLYLYMVEQEHFRPRTVRYVHGALKRALKAAVRNGDLVRNPAEFATLPKDNPKAEVVPGQEDEAGRVRVLDQQQAAAFLTAAREEDWHSALWYVLLTTGLRPGEALALKWSSVDLDSGAVHVRATLTRVGVKQWRLTKPKTERSRRTVPLPLVTIHELRRWRARQSAERMAAGEKWQDHDFVFTTPRGSPLDHSNLAERCFRRVMERAGLGKPKPVVEVPPKPKGRHGPQAKAKRVFEPSVRIYALRHTFASLLLADGVPLLVVSRLLGHTSIKLTADVYSHVLPKDRDEAAGHFDRLFRIA